jgi:hypothetical protein
VAAGFYRREGGLCREPALSVLARASVMSVLCQCYVLCVMSPVLCQSHASVMSVCSLLIAEMSTLLISTSVRSVCQDRGCGIYMWSDVDIRRVISHLTQRSHSGGQGPGGQGRETARHEVSDVPRYFEVPEVLRIWATVPLCCSLHNL